MTRAELRWALAGYTFPPVSQVGVETWQRIHDGLAAELDKTCATCKWFLPSGAVPWAACALKGGMYTPPQDGSGYCCYWQAGRLDTEAPPPLHSSQGDAE